MSRVALELRDMGAVYNPKSMAAVIMKSRNAPRGEHCEDPLRIGIGPAERRYQYFQHSSETARRCERLSQAKIAVLMFASGRFVCVGANTEASAQYVLANTVVMLRSIGYSSARVMNCVVCNRVSNTQLPWKLDIGTLASNFTCFCSYDPALFPGVILRYPPNGSITVLVFDTGKLVITGGRGACDDSAALDKVFPFLEGCALKDDKTNPLDKDFFVRPNAKSNARLQEIVLETLRGCEDEAEAEAVPEPAGPRARRPKQRDVRVLDLPRHEDIKDCLLSLNCFAEKERVHEAAAVAALRARLVPLIVEHVTAEPGAAKIGVAISRAWGAFMEGETGFMHRLLLEGLLSSVQKDSGDALLEYSLPLRRPTKKRKAGGDPGPNRKSARS